MALDDGTYVVVNANSGMALDVRGASDRSGENVQQWTVNRGDAQIWSLVTTDGTSALRCSLTGRTLDVAGGSMKDGSNVQQWDDNGSEAQRWVLAADGKAATVGGTSYDTYVVKCAKDESFVLDVTYGGKTAGSNVQIYTANGSDAQRWAFVPVPCLTEGGTYAIVSALDDDIVVDVAGGSTANGARVQTYAWNASAAQIFRAVVDASTSLVSLVCAKSGKALDSDGAARDGVPVHQWQYDASNANQRWLPVQSGTMVANGQTVPTYVLRAMSSSGRCMDVAGGSRAIATTVQCWTANGSLAQRFYLRKAELETGDLPTPARLGATTASGSWSDSRSISHDGTVTVYPCWCAPSGRYKVRYKTISHHADGSADTESAWANIVDGTTSNEGWGDAWTSDVDDWSYMVACPHGVSVTTSQSVDCVSVRFQVRSYSDDVGGWRAHGPAADATVDVARPATLSVGSVAFDPSRGLVATVSSDSPRRGCTASVRVLSEDGSTPLSGRVSATGLSQAAEVVVPVGSLYSVPRPGDPVTVDVTWETTYASTSSTIQATISSATVGTLSYEASHDAATLCDLVDLPYGTEDRVWELVERGHGSELVACPGWRVGEKMRFRVPTCGPTRVFMSSGAGSSYSVAEATLGDELNELVWVWGERWERCAAMSCAIGGAPTQDRGYTASVSVSDTAGRDLPVAHGGPTVTVDLDAEGAVLPGDAAPRSEASIDALAHAMADGFVPLFRSPAGDTYRVAVKSVKATPTYRHVKVSVEQEAVSA
ncbi:RICIN domain-containing protein [Parafannyhessea umbonata]|nr:RICIN domain-containing protein [Parafannyhessea umbonata]